MSGKNEWKNFTRAIRTNVTDDVVKLRKMHKDASQMRNRASYLVVCNPESSTLCLDSEERRVRALDGDASYSNTNGRRKQYYNQLAECARGELARECGAAYFAFLKEIYDISWQPDSADFTSVVGEELKEEALHPVYEWLKRWLVDPKSFDNSLGEDHTRLAISRITTSLQEWSSRSPCTRIRNTNITNHSFTKKMREVGIYLNSRSANDPRTKKTARLVSLDRVAIAQEYFLRGWITQEEIKDVELSLPEEEPVAPLLPVDSGTESDQHDEEPVLKPAQEPESVEPTQVDELDGMLQEYVADTQKREAEFMDPFARLEQHRLFQRYNREKNRIVLFEDRELDEGEKLEQALFLKDYKLALRDATAICTPGERIRLPTIWYDRPDEKEHVYQATESLLKSKPIAAKRCDVSGAAETMFELLA